MPQSTGITITSRRVKLSLVDDTRWIQLGGGNALDKAAGAAQGACLRVVDYHRGCDWAWEYVRGESTEALTSM